MHAIVRQGAIAAASAVCFCWSSWSAQAQTPAPADASLYIIYPGDGQRIRGSFPVRFGLRNMGITHAGDRTPNTGHHHLLVDVDEAIEPNEPIPTDKQHIHFGAGQTETRLELPPGKHVLQLVLGDADHKPFAPLLISKKITVTVLPPRVRRSPQISRAERESGIRRSGSIRP
ncbi:DUF4399 domain-containing protein [Microvirga sp. CF3062]|jgi:hypothetical protein|uniref:DUF4399 domain-containing protein n=1 Tax=Microvirga sp. CF3062 TaxID=3110182 RepID=UPI002E7A2B8D|nr:DUF4399 domain-containing protein [Microvirga sp. CF3062]MEE1658341.1 DUF4399 domain-containing protein [Microvirga sp. CF3062]